VILPTRFLLLCVSALALLSCQTMPPQSDEQIASREFTILHINDVYRIGGVIGGTAGGLGRVRTLRRQLEREHGTVLLLHGGDFLFPSLLSREYRGAQMIDILNRLDGAPGVFDPNMLVVYGNHEFDKAGLKSAPELTSRIEASEFNWLDTNITWLKDEAGIPYVASGHNVATVLLEIEGVAVGLFGLTTDKVQPAYASIDNDYAAVARHATAELRERGAEVVIALTHMKVSRDAKLLAELGDAGPDVIFGGHDHTRQEVNVDGRFVLKADADALSAVIAEVSVGTDKDVRVSYQFHELGQAAAIDENIDKQVQEWHARFSRQFCESESLQVNCLEIEHGRTQVTLEGKETKIRLVETNLGNFLADTALAAYADQGADIAFLNSGTMRINQDIPAGSSINERHLVEIFQYPVGLQLFRITGAQLQAAVDHAVEDWTGNGWWLQVAGFGFIHDPDAITATQLSLIRNGEVRPIDPEEELLAVTSDYLLSRDSGQDGYHMLDPANIVDTGPLPRLINLVRAAIVAAGEDGIAPTREGRICNTRFPPPQCLITGRWSE
jgi:2',3'-cyclic-nucleotide 2'-phosphodiesterase (5'-nucleotidase family)